MGPLTLARAAARNALLWRTCLYAWLFLLVLPSLTTFTTTYSWDASPVFLLAATLWFFAFAWALLPVRWFFAVTYPLALFSVMFLGADFLRGANLLELVMLAGGGLDWHEVYGALRAYLVAIGLGALFLAIPVVIAWVREPAPRFRRRIAIPALAAAGALLVALAPAVFLRAWPINLASLGIASWLGRGEFIATALPWAPIDPRKPGASWHAKRTGPAPEAETYVVVIGESVRSDRMQACGSSRAVAQRTPTITYCDVMAGSSSTHTSVPLLVSRDMPGGALRVSADATFLKAFEAAGFRTYWLSLQGPTIAWPDANVARYADPRGTDREDLMGMIRDALAEPQPRKLLVIHAYNAHFPYCTRYKAADAVVPVDCATLGNTMTFEKRQGWLDSYDNAVHESLAFNDAVIAELERQPGETFFAYTPDHGENLMDDDRRLAAHSLKHPTVYDTRVPFIFWANSAWRGRHADSWRNLESHAKSRAMHADLVPTLLGAAGIAYDEPRREIADLTRAAPPARKRVVLERLGVVVDGDTLR